MDIYWILGAIHKRMNYDFSDNYEKWYSRKKIKLLQTIIISALWKLQYQIPREKIWKINRDSNPEPLDL